MLNWIKYSGASISITINPYHWRWTPVAREAFIDEWCGPNEWSGSVRWLCLTIRVWIDDGSW